MSQLSQDFWNFISNNPYENPADLKLKYSGKNIGFSLDLALTQIEARRRAASKIPSFLDNPQFIFPSIIASEQASNEAVARYHASLVGPVSLLDLTAGLGIDDMSMAMAGAFVTACEIDADKCDALRHNATLFGLDDHLDVHCGDSLEFLRATPLAFDVIFADPARRASSGARTHALADCTPDILAAMPLIMSKTKRFIVKCSPMLDLTEIRKTVENLHQIHIVCFRGECKEVLLDIRLSPDSLTLDSSHSTFHPDITVVDLDWHSTISRFDIPSSPHLTPHNPHLTTPNSTTHNSQLTTHTYLYEPNAGMMKTGAWDYLMVRFPALVKADKNTHLFLSDTLYEDFPGKVMRIISQPDKKALKALKGSKINVATRNYPLSAPELEKKLGVKPGGDRRLYAFRLSGTPTILIAEPV